MANSFLRRAPQSRPVQPGIMPIPLTGGMHGFDDEASAPRGASKLIKNMAFRGGLWRMRDASLERGQERAPQVAGTGEIRFGSFNGEIVATSQYSAIAVDAVKTDYTATSLSLLGTTLLKPVSKIFFGDDGQVFFVLDDGSMFQADITAWSTASSIGGSSLVNGDVCYAARRLFFAGYERSASNVFLPGVWSDPTLATASADLTFTNIGTRDGTPNTIEAKINSAASTPYIRYNFAASGVNTIIWDLLPLEPGLEVPVRLVIFDGVGEIARQDDFIATAGAEGWTQVVVDVSKLADPTYCELQFPNPTLNARVGVAATNLRGVHAIGDEFIYSIEHISDTSGAYLLDDTASIYWSETDDLEYVRPQNFERITGGYGKLRLVRQLPGNRLVAMKERGIFIYQITADPDRPIVPMDSIDDVGALNGRCWAEFDGAIFFGGPNGIYAWDGRSLPVNLSVRQGQWDLRSQMNLDSTTFMAVNPGTRELLVFTKVGSDVGKGVWVFSLDYQHWSYFEYGEAITDAIPAMDSSGNWRVLAGTRDNYLHYTEDSSSTTDSIGDAQAEAIFELYPIEAPSPYPHVTLEWIELVHAIRTFTAGQIEVTFSHDNGVTWSPHNTGSPIVAAESVKPIRVPMVQTGSKILVRIRYTGDMGGSRFNFSRVNARLVPRGGGYGGDFTAVSDTI